MKKPKRYTEEEQENSLENQASEPVALYGTTDINTLKIQVMEQVMKTDNPKILEAVEDLIIELSFPKDKKRPGQYSLEELKEEIQKSEEEIKAGKFVTWDDLKKEWDKW